MKKKIGNLKSDIQTADAFCGIRLCLRVTSLILPRKKIPNLKADKAQNPLDELWAYAYNFLMARPLKCRCIECRPNSYYFKPRGIPMTALQEVSLRMDELEAIRLADYQGLYHEEAAAKMEISRATFGRVLNEARRKVAEAILQGKALKIETPMEKKGEQNEGRFCRAKR
jgi:predicted DNA-binding protein (UPF0251 family)